MQSHIQIFRLCIQLAKNRVIPELDRQLGVLSFFSFARFLFVGVLGGEDISSRGMSLGSCHCGNLGEGTAHDRRALIGGHPQQEPLDVLRPGERREMLRPFRG